MCILTISRCKDQEFSNKGTVGNGHPNTHSVDNKKAFGNAENILLIPLIKTSKYPV